MNSVYFKKTEQSGSILRHSAVRYSTFCGSLFNSTTGGLKSGQFNQNEKLHFCNKGCGFIRAPPLAKKTASLIKKETLEKRISNDMGYKVKPLAAAQTNSAKCSFI
jgi:hypothetical protein